MKKIVHHIDADGHMGAYVVYLNEVLKENETEYEFIKFNYGYDLPEFEETDEVILVDISFPMKDMIEISKKVKRFVWIDHHISAIKEFEAVTEEHNIVSYLRTDYAGCENAWLYYNNEDEKSIPLEVKLIGQYDNWNHEDYSLIKNYDFEDVEDSDMWDSIVVPYKTYFDTIVEDPIDVINYMADYKDIYCAITGGELIMKYLKKNYKYQLKHVQFRTIYTEEEVYSVAVVNSQQKTSLLFESLEKEVDIFCVYYETKHGDYSVSLYSNDPDVDVSKIAKAHSGGGSLWF